MMMMTIKTLKTTTKRTNTTSMFYTDSDGSDSNASLALEIILDSVYHRAAYPVLDNM